MDVATEVVMWFFLGSIAVLLITSGAGTAQAFSSVGGWFTGEANSLVGH